MTAAYGLPIEGFELARTDGSVRDPAALADADPEWLAAVVPGGVHESLLAAGRIPHPYEADGEDRVRWVEDATWWYRATFDRPDSPGGTAGRIRLVCHCLDTVAELWLNGAPLGTHASQFRPAGFDVTDRLAATGNVLLIRFDPPLDGLYDLAAASEPARSIELMRANFYAHLPEMLPPGADPSAVRPAGVAAQDPAITLRRKATFSWGWDFAPRLPSVGVAGPVELRVAHGAELTDVRVRTLRTWPFNRIQSPEARRMGWPESTVARSTSQGTVGARRSGEGPAGESGSAEVEISVAADAFADAGPLTARITLTGPDGEPVARTLTLADGVASVTVRLDRAYLWWTHDLGTPHRYAVRADLYAGDGTLLDTAERTTGIRTIELDRSPDTEEGGRLFRFVLNGVPIFARGANWVPPDMLTGSIKADAYRPLVDRAVAANMNMLRVWGGGVYPAEAFWAACDAAGVLVWQDFMFACVDYPDDATGDAVGLPAEIAAEAEYQVRRLRGHPSLALWCGNNEVQEIHAGLRGGLNGDGWGRSFFHELLPEVVARLDPDTPYWPGSPWGEDDPGGVGGVRDGDRHAWEVWHGQDKGAGGPAEFASRGEAVHFTRYAYDRGKFISEFGIHSSPEPGTLRRWAGDVDLHSPGFDRRIKDAPATKGDALLAYETGMPYDVASYADFSMATQAEGMKFGIEHYRRRRPHCSGALLWQFNDAWPGMSWSLLDYDGVGKAAYYFAQRAFAPVLASFTWSASGGLALWVTNDLRTDVSVRLRVRVATFTGATVLAEDVSAPAPAGSSLRVWSAEADRVAGGPDRYAWAEPVDGSEELVGANRLFFGPVKRLEFGPSRLEWRVVRAAEGCAELELTGHGYTYLARVAAPAPGVTFSTNYLDLRDGDTVRIAVRGLPAGFDPADLEVAGYAGQGYAGQDSAATG